MYSQKVIFFHSLLHDPTKLHNYKEYSEDMLLAELSSSVTSPAFIFFGFNKIHWHFTQKMSELWISNRTTEKLRGDYVLRFNWVQLSQVLYNRKGKVFIICEENISAFIERQWKLFLKIQAHFLPVIEHTSEFFWLFNVFYIPYGETIYIQSHKCYNFHQNFYKSSQVRKKLSAAE